MWAMLSSVDCLGMRAGLDGGVLGRQAERVPAERMQHVEAAHPLRPRHHVADDVVPDVPDVRVARRVREHLQAVELRTRRVDLDLERARRRPLLLPLLVELLRLVVGHRVGLHSTFFIMGLQRTGRPGSSRAAQALGRPSSRRDVFSRRRRTNAPPSGAHPSTSSTSTTPGDLEVHADRAELIDNGCRPASGESEVRRERQQSPETDHKSGNASDEARRLDRGFSELLRLAKWALCLFAAAGALA